MHLFKRPFIFTVENLPHKYLVILAIMLFGCVATSAIGGNVMNENVKCNLSSVKESQEMILTILDDIEKNYSMDGGGGITKINLIATNVYVVNISQEERIDQITYELSINNNCKAVIQKKTLSAISKNRRIN